jgi:hypothetical protein
MMKATEFCDCYDRSILHDLTLNRALFVERRMRTGSMVIAEIGSQRPFQAQSVQNDEVVQTLPSY